MRRTESSVSFKFKVPVLMFGWAAVSVLLIAATFTRAEAAPRATRPAVFCKILKNGKAIIHNAQSEVGHFDCAPALADSKSCFVGKRSEVIALIDSRQFDWDEEWLEGADFKGPNEISYHLKDGPNNLRTRLTMSRCTRSFFRVNSAGPYLISN